MLEIIILFQLTKAIGSLAIQKGQNPGTWKTRVVLTWFGVEILGAFVVYLVTQEFIFAALGGLVCAYIGYRLTKSALEKMPDYEEILPDVPLFEIQTNQTTNDTEGIDLRK